MKNETVDYGIRTRDDSLPTDASIWMPSFGGDKISATGRSSAWVNLAFAAWAFSAWTSPVTYIDTTAEVRRSGASSVSWTAQNKRRKRLSLAQAWKQVRRVFDEAEGFRVQQRAVDARDLADVILDKEL
jgi:hypothetical protein